MSGVEINTGSTTFESLVTKFTELTDMVNALTAKVTEMGTMQENITVKEERMYDIGTSEAWQANMKRMFDEYMDAGIESVRRSRLQFDQLTQNAIENANMTAKQAIRHAEIAIAKQWKCECGCACCKEDK